MQKHVYHRPASRTISARLTSSSANDVRALAIIEKLEGEGHSLHDIVQAAILKFDGQTPHTDRAMATLLGVVVEKLEVAITRIERLELSAPTKKGRQSKGVVEINALEFVQGIFADD